MFKWNFYGLKKNEKLMISRALSKMMEIEEIKKKFSDKNLGEGFWEISMVNDQEMAELNWKFRQIEGITDVLSFEYPDEKTGLLGEVYLNRSKIELQANQRKWSIEKEVVFLVVHGILHTLGYDHQKLADFEKMFAIKRRILDFPEIEEVIDELKKDF